MTFHSEFEAGGDEEPEASGSQCALARIRAGHEDVFWREACALENYYRSDLDYEDYAPAYCVGYVGFAQYGGSYEDAQVSLWSNWARIKGDSRLAPHDAHMAMRAAWSRMESLRDLGAETAAEMDDALADARVAESRPMRARALAYEAA
jgi:hypothetical protein